jgi:hypothetical protein
MSAGARSLQRPHDGHFPSARSGEWLLLGATVDAAPAGRDRVDAQLLNGSGGEQLRDELARGLVGTSVPECRQEDRAVADIPV